MTILVDLTPIPLERTGVGVYADELVERLPFLLSDSDQMLLLAQSDDPRFATLGGHVPGVKVLTVSSTWARHRGLLFLYEQCVLPFVLWRNRVQVLHSLHYSHPLLCTAARVVTVHDLTHSLFPELHTRARGWLTPFFVGRAMRHAECVVFVSASTQSDAERLFGRPRFAGRVVPLGVSAADISSGEEMADAELWEMRVTRPYVLFLGTMEPRKNFRRLLQAFERVAAQFPALTLVVAGKLGWHYEDDLAAIEASSVRERIHPLGFVTATQKAALLRGCTLLAYPSLYEGFGLPVLEAMAQGAPVVTSHLSSLPEVAGDAAVLVDPLSVEAIARGLEEVLADPEMRAAMRQRGRERVKKFTWQRMAAGTLEAYREAFSRRHGGAKTRG